jgi:hypothetical protein
MTRGRHPQVAIAEAMHAAGTQGYLVVPLAVQDLPFDFIIHFQQSMAFVRVRRLRYATYDPGDILDSCAAEIAELRGIPFSQEIGRELWARGPGRGWHQYRVFPDTIGEIGNDGSINEPDAGPQGSGILPDDRIIPFGSSPPPVPPDPGDPRPVPAGSHSRELKPFSIKIHGE